ncbi:hypothetical protein [Ferrimonas sp. SCSIO 43195]|uniref:hypothetical protein n=1 Tax=Ferrimonas sp. SCSIO 43195 TaxID=2822844 RepID=UPI0020759A34|nr:hypothetical protein [Ferrimonas sp. SCSIO 43195]USD39494.1 hypothetical protein J8Z22_10615 [Ferrimonas sp. SCSIO 43195]
MNKLVAPLLLISLVGCSSKFDSSNSLNGKRFLNNDVTQHEIGQRDNNLGAVHFSLILNDASNSTVKVNFDQLPYHSRFDLCEDTGNYDDLSKVVTNNNGDSHPIYERKKVDCNSEVFVTKDSQGNYLISYNLNFLIGYRVVSLKGYDAMLPQTKHRLLERRFVQSNSVQLIDSKAQISLDI